MYRTCLFCNKDLGANAVVEHFPIGRRLAFDAAKGRLWVVCRHCERWNLTPLDERWEAIEECERLYREARLRVSTDNVALAKLREGLELVRIGAPLRPEFAAWRYGDQFGRRRTRQLLVVGAGLAGVGALVAGGIAAGVGVVSFGGLISQGMRMIQHGRPDTIVATVPLDAHRAVRVRRRHMAETSLRLDDDGRIVLDLRFVRGRELLVGKAAERAAALLMPKVNRFGGKRETVADAVREIEREGGSEAFIASLARIARITTRPPSGPTAISKPQDLKTGLFGLPEPHRIAFEMALHEEAERRALAGELAELTTAWRQAEEIAAIADDLLLPGG